MVEVGDLFFGPTLFDSFVKSRLDDFCSHGNATADIGGFGLGSTHSTESRSDEDDALHVVLVEVLSGRIQESERGSVNDSLRADIAE